MTSLRNKTISGLIWSFIQNFSEQLITLIVGIYLARLLTPKDFGLVGMITIFIAVSKTFISSGFSQALIRKKDCTDTDYSTVFFFNLIAAILFYIVLFFSASAISVFFDEIQLIAIIKVLAIVLIIDSFTIIQNTILIKRIDFKLLTKVTITSSIISGIIGITMASYGYGVWSLVAKILSQRFINSSLLWILNRWRPCLVFSMNSFRHLFSFGSKLLVSSLIETTYKNIYLLVIGKYFSAQALGFYTKATQFKKFPSESITGIISRVSYPVLSQIQDKPHQLKNGYKKLIINTTFITFLFVLGMAAIAEPMIITLIGEQWRTSIIYLQLLCFVAMLYPLHSLNLNMLKVQGRSDLFLKLEIIKKILAVPVIIIGIFLGIEIMILGMIVNSFIAYFLNSYWSGKFINYSIKEQIADILPSFILALSISIGVYIFGIILPFSFLVILIMQILLGGILVFIISEVIQFKPYIEIKNIAINKINSFRSAGK